MMDKQYYRNGQLSRKENYRYGEKDGLWEHYHENGQLKFKGNYKDGERKVFGNTILKMAS